MTLFVLRFWSRREDTDDEFDAGAAPFVLEETGRVRDLDGDPENANAPWWDVELVARLEADSADEAWLKVTRYINVSERLSTA